MYVWIVINQCELKEGIRVGLKQYDLSNDRLNGYKPTMGKCQDSVSREELPLVHYSVREDSLLCACFKGWWGLERVILNWQQSLTTLNQKKTPTKTPMINDNQRQLWWRSQRNKRQWRHVCHCVTELYKSPAQRKRKPKVVYSIELQQWTFFPSKIEQIPHVGHESIWNHPTVLCHTIVTHGPKSLRA